MSLHLEQSLPSNGTLEKGSRGGAARRLTRVAMTTGLVVGLAFGMTSTAYASDGGDGDGTNGNVHSAQWEDGLYGPYLRVVPTLKGRFGANVNPRGVLEEAERKAGHKDLTDAQQSSLYNQLRCHSGLKSKWDLDAWRPDVGYWSTARDGCNPLPSNGGKSDEDD